MVIFLNTKYQVDMLFFPNAKINIGLHITNKRPDGYHNIETLFCPVDLSDILEFVPLPGHQSGKSVITVTGIEVEGPAEKNLCVKAYELLCRDFELPAVDIHLHKMIPPGAGLGGGSSDAAFMLKMLNNFFHLQLDEDSLCRYASILGSDCAFFIKNRPLLGFERGNVFEEPGPLPLNFQVIIVNPGFHISTPEAYSGVIPAQPADSLKTLIRLPLDQWKNCIINDFEKTIFEKHPVIANIKQLLYDQGAVYASMSGSGSSVYGLFEKFPEELSDHFPGMFCRAVKPLSACSP